MISRKTGVLAILSAAVIAGGCSRNRTAGERMLEPVDPQPTPAVQPDTQPSPTTIAVATRPATTTATIVATTTVSTRPIVAPAPASRPEPIWVAADADTATRMRNWKPSFASYPTGNTIAGPVYRFLPPEPRTRNADDVLWIDAYTDVLAVGGLFAAPFWMLGTPPNTAVEYRGVDYPPSYTLTDPYPDDYIVKVPGIVQMRRAPMSQEWVEKTIVKEPAGSTGEKRIQGSSMDSLPGDRR